MFKLGLSEWDQQVITHNKLSHVPPPPPHHNRSDSQTSAKCRVLTDINVFLIWMGFDITFNLNVKNLQWYIRDGSCMFTCNICCVAVIGTSFKSNSSECKIVTDGRGVLSIDSPLILSFLMDISWYRECTCNLLFTAFDLHCIYEQGY